MDNKFVTTADGNCIRVSSILTLYVEMIEDGDYQITAIAGNNREYSLYITETEEDAYYQLNVIREKLGIDIIDIND